MKEKATIYDFQRYFKTKGLDPMKLYFSLSTENIEQTNEAVLKWCKENPLETRQDKFLKMYPGAELNEGILRISPCILNSKLKCEASNCSECRKKYWLEGVEE